MLPSTQIWMVQIWENKLVFSRDFCKENFRVVADHQKYFWLLPGAKVRGMIGRVLWVKANDKNCSSQTRQSWFYGHNCRQFCNFCDAGIMFQQSKRIFYREKSANQQRLHMAKTRKMQTSKGRRTIDPSYRTWRAEIRVLCAGTATKWRHRISNQNNPRENTGAIILDDT